MVVNMCTGDKGDDDDGYDLHRCVHASTEDVDCRIARSLGEAVQKRLP